MSLIFDQIWIAEVVSADDFQPPRLLDTILHSFATYRPEDGSDMRAVQGRLGRRDRTTRMINTHVLNREPAAVRSPGGRLLGGW